MLWRAFSERVLFSGALNMVRTGRERIVEEEDFPELPASLQPDRAPPGFANLKFNSRWQFIRSVAQAVRWDLVLMVVFVCSAGIAMAATPVALKELIQWIDGSGYGQGLLWVGLAWAIVLPALSIIEMTFLHHYFFTALKMKVRITNGLNERVIRHSLRLTRAARQRNETGDVVNFMGTDADMVSDAIWISVELIYAALVVTLTAIILFNYIGLAAIAAYAALAVMAPLSLRVAKRFARFDDQIMSMRDKRVSMISQSLTGIRVVKFFGWDRRVRHEIEQVRNKEVAGRFALARTRALSVLMYVSCTTVVSVAAFGTYVAMGNTLDAAIVFSCVAVFVLLEHPFGNMTHFVAELAQGAVSAGRLIAFFKEPVLDAKEDARSEPDQALGVQLDNVSGRYDDGEDSVLSGLNLSIKPGESVAIVGPVGAGKSSLLGLLLGEVPQTSGAINWQGLGDARQPRVAYVSQEAFIMNGTLRDNITFCGDQSDLINEAVTDSALEQDLRLLAHGLETEIGEHGVNLSGGQKQRVSLARAIVDRPGVVLLDDPLSAVDHGTEDFLVENLLFGRWQNVTRICVTHRLRHLERFDRVVFVENGQVVADGPPESAIKQSPRLQAFISERQATDDAEGIALPQTNAVAEETESARITEDEDRERGAVQVRTYLDYFQALGGRKPKRRRLVLTLLVLSTLLVAALPVLQNAWLAVWTGRGEVQGLAAYVTSVFSGLRGSDLQNVAIYGGIGLLVLLGVFAQQLIWGIQAAVAGRDMHAAALKATLRSPLRFFDSTPVGRILNRFSRDVDSVERNLAWSFEACVRSIVHFTQSVAVMALVVPWVLLASLPAGVLFHRLQKDYRAVAREAQRLMALTRSPRFAHFKETLQGLAVIRAYGRGEEFVSAYQVKLERNQRSFYALFLLNRWFSVRIPMVSAIVSVVLGIGVVFAAHRGAMDTGLAGLALIYAMQFWDHLNWAVRSFSETESHMTSVERLQYYSSLRPEHRVVMQPALLSEVAWPVRGEVEFRNLHAGYAPGLPDILRGLSLKIPAGARVGIIGRTGAGKSTVFQTLFRFIPIRSGGLFVDGVDVRRVPLLRLRRSLAIIPQDPTLFNGTLRSNLDRFGRFADEQIWDALEQVHMGRMVRGLKDGLSTAVTEDGQNFSQGQRQLLCLARALLVDAKVIALDEATASVDAETDALIQMAIRRACRGKTMLIIAHRLGTVRDCDMIVELAHGRVHQVRSGSERVDVTPVMMPATPRSPAL